MLANARFDRWKEKKRGGVPSWRERSPFGLRREAKGGGKWGRDCSTYEGRQSGRGGKEKESVN